MTQGYPPGTKCVITMTNENCALRDIRIGDVVTIALDVVVFDLGGQPCQPLNEGLPLGGARWVAHRIAWMRPIDKDTDEDDQEVIRQMHTIRVRDRVTKLDPAWGEGVEK